MPAPIPVPVRQALFQRWRKGVSVSRLAEELGLRERTVRHLVGRLVQRGQPGLAPDYARCATKAVATDEATYQKAVQLRQQHPTWGAGLIRVFLQEELGTAPSERTLQRWLASAAQTPAPPGRRPSSNSTRARRPHEVWQMDAADQMRLAGGQRASWLRLADECSGAVLHTAVFPPGVLEPGGTEGRATSVAPAIYAVGTPGTFPGRQRQPLGIGG